MNKKFWFSVLNSFSDNRKSKIENPKLLGLAVITFALVLAGAVAQAQQPKKIPRLRYLGGGLSSNPARIEAFRQGLRELVSPS